VKSKL